MKKSVLFLVFSLFLGLSLCAQEVIEETTQSVTEQSVEKKSGKSDYQLKLEEKEAKRTVKALKKQNKLERSILKLENTIKTNGIKLEKLTERHNNTHNGLSDVDREKLELKMAKLEMAQAKNKAKLKKLRKKVI